MKKTGFFGGSFDPIHFGHLNLAIQMLEAHGLDEILFCPANVSPFKEKAPPKASAQQRKKMVELAIQGIPQFKILTWELEREKPSYTIDTIKYLLSIEEQKIYLIVGEDALQSINKWKESKELLSLATPIAGKRTMEISSTDIRERLHSKKYCGHLIPAKVLDYIHQNHIY